MSRNSYYHDDRTEIVFSAILLVLAVLTAWSSIIGSIEMTVLTGLVTAALAAIMAVSGRKLGF